MKQLQLATILLLCGFLSLHAQPSGINSIPDGFSSGSVILPDNSTHEGYIKDNLKKNGEVIFLSRDGKKIKYTATQISGVTIDSHEYTVINNVFYKLVTDGTKIKLLRKASNSSAIQYNGSEAVVVNSDEGSYDDYFLQTVSTKKVQLVRKKDFLRVFMSTCADCTTLINDIKANKLGFAEIEQAVTVYNACNN